METTCQERNETDRQTDNGVMFNILSALREHEIFLLALEMTLLYSESGDKIYNNLLCNLYSAFIEISITGKYIK